LNVRTLPHFHIQVLWTWEAHFIISVDFIYGYSH
jgi:hypothetical protein